MKHYIEGKTVVITGGSSGFGLETARILLEMGAKVAITGRSQQRLDEAAAELAHADLLPVQADATRTDDWRRLLDQVLARWQRLDVLVNNHGAGIKIDYCENLDDATIAEVLDVNLTSVIKGCREAVRVMKPNGSGHIVNVSSGCAYHSWPMWAVYSAAKDGMVGFTRCLHLEMAEWGGKATSFIPGAARTNFCPAANLPTDWLEGFPSAYDFARTLVHCIDIPEGSFVEEVNIWGTAQVRDLTPF